MSFEQNPLEQLKLRGDRKEPPARPTFPQADFERDILRPGFDQHRAHLFTPTIQVLRVHTLMLAEQRLLNEAPAGRILAALRAIETTGPEAVTYSRQAEDVIRAVDALLEKAVWPDSAGSLRLARSLNDVNATINHIWMRDTVLGILSAVLALRERLTETAWQHLTTLMPAHTHAQVAQPTTLAHYLSAVIGPLQRDTARLRALFERVNRSPLGTAAFATSAINIRREQSAKLLGFDGLIENGFDAVAATDHFQEFVSTLEISAGGLSRFIQDLMYWVRTEVGGIQIGADFLQSSTLMPQKENPAVLEHIRARLADLHGTNATMAAMIRSTPVGEAVEFETGVRRPLLAAAREYLTAIRLLSAVLKTMHVNRPLLANRAGRYFSTTTDLVDLLAIDFQVPYHHAFAITQQVIQTAVERGLDTMDLTSELIDEAALRVIGEEIGIEVETLHQCLAPRRFVERRSSLGGPAPSTVRAFLERERLARGREQGWIAETRDRIDQELTRLDERASALEASAKG